MNGSLARAASAVAALALAAILSTPPPQPETFSNIPPTLSGKQKSPQFLIQSTRASCALLGVWIDGSDDDESRRRREAAGEDQAAQVGEGAAVHLQVRRHLHPRRRGPPQRQEASCSVQGTIPQPAVLLGRVLRRLQSHQGWRRWPMRSFDREKKQHFKPRQSMNSGILHD